MLGRELTLNARTNKNHARCKHRIHTLLRFAFTFSTPQNPPKLIFPQCVKKYPQRIPPVLQKLL
jgi:hypothetical protein